jgi:hypothetical protein
MMRTETAYCCVCRRPTTWTGRGARLHCSGCGADFPCAHRCKHWDCLEAKGLAAPDEKGILRLVSSAGAPDSDLDADLPAG